MEYFILTMMGMTLVLMSLVFVLTPDEILEKAGITIKRK